MSRARSQLSFHAVRTEGGLLPPDVLQRISVLDPKLPGTRAEDYHLISGERFGEVVSRSWSRLVSAWRSFQDVLTKLPEGDAATTVTRERWLLPLFHELGYGRLSKVSAALQVEGKSYAVSHIWQCTPIHLLGCRISLETRERGVAGAARSSPHSLVQELLNRSDDYLWGFLSNGLTLRLLRDHRSLTQQAYVEFDLEAIMEGEQYGEFFLLWLVCHQSRVEAEKPEECWLERWLLTARNEGVNALDKLRQNVEAAISALGTGFLKHRANAALQTRLGDGTLTKRDYYRQLLRLVYRLIFLFVAEDREALLDPKAPEAARALYRRFYTTHRLRRLCDRRRGGPHGDLWQGLRLVMNKLWAGSPELALPALGSFLWSDQALPDIDAAECANEYLLLALHRLCFLQDGKQRYPVNWRNVGSDELGGVYESLLELLPDIDRVSGTFALKISPGNERKTTGSYYTPTPLVDSLLDSALDPVLDAATRGLTGEAATRAILNLKVCDPACGSGHFLVAAARRIAKRLAYARSGDLEPAPQEIQRALRDVVGHCIYGVDQNPMAVELCKVSLWMEAIDPGRPLSFLDNHIQEGNAVIGALPALLEKGIPDEAFEPLSGDDKDVVKRLKKRNREGRKGQAHFDPLFATAAGGSKKDYARLASEAQSVERDADDDIGSLHKKEEHWARLKNSPEFSDASFLCHFWCAAFVWPKQAGELETAAPTEDLWQVVKIDVSKTPQATRRMVRQLAREYAFFHWHLAFPQVFLDGLGAGTQEAEPQGNAGFDVVLGNPPWEHTELKEKEWFAERSPSIAGARTTAERKRMIESLKQEDPKLHAEFAEALREHDGKGHFLGNSGRYPLCGRGRINLYAVFAEGMRNLLGPQGRIGCVLPTGIATDDTTKFFFQEVVEKKSLVSLFDFENKGIFEGVHSSYKFCLFTSGRGVRPTAEAAEFICFAHSVEDLRAQERRFTLTPSDIALLNPNTSNFPIFRSRADAALTKGIYRRIPVLIREGSADGNPWGLSFSQGLFNMAADSHHFRSALQLEAEGYRLQENNFVSPFDCYLPLYEAKMMHQFDHRWATYTSVEDSRDVTAEEKADPHFRAQPRYWVREAVVRSALPRRPELLAVALDQPESSRPTSLKRAFSYWLRGWSTIHGHEEQARGWHHLLKHKFTDRTSVALSRLMIDLPPTEFYLRHPLLNKELDVLADPEADLEALAREIVERFSPKWLMGWRDICRSTDERTLIASALSCVAVGHTLPLFFTEHPLRTDIISLLACMGSFAADYALRQKVGGIHITYNLFKQFPLPSPEQFLGDFPCTGTSLAAFIAPRALELLYTTKELRPLAEASGYHGPPFLWDQTQRFQLRCELDAAFFHLYLPADVAGNWQMAKDETPEQMAELRRHFPRPRDAVAYILDTFPIVKKKDEAQYGHYRTKETILRIYDALAIAQCTGQAYVSPLSPPPGMTQS